MRTLWKNLLKSEWYIYPAILPEGRPKPEINLFSNVGNHFCCEQAQSKKISLLDFDESNKKIGTPQLKTNFFSSWKHN